jgi:hypothetical protein
MTVLFIDKLFFLHTLNFFVKEAPFEIKFIFVEEAKPSPILLIDPPPI